MSKLKKNIVWLVSYPKSGNTWMRVILKNLLSEKMDPVDINQLELTHIASSREIFDRYSGTNSSDLSKNEVLNLRPHVYRNLSKSTNEKLFIKAHDAWQLTLEEEELFPKEITHGVLYLIRNPLDIAVSYSFHNSISIDESIKRINNPKNTLASAQTKIFSQLEQNLFSWSDHVRSWTEKSNHRLHIIKYEDLISNTFQTIAKAFTSLEIGYDFRDLTLAVNNSSFQNLQKQERETGFREKPQTNSQFFRDGKSNNWESFLNNENIESIISEHDIMMKKFGYLSKY